MPPVLFRCVFFVALVASLGRAHEGPSPVSPATDVRFDAQDLVLTPADR